MVRTATPEAAPRSSAAEGQVPTDMQGSMAMSAAPGSARTSALTLLLVAMLATAAAAAAAAAPAPPRGRSSAGGDHSRRNVPAGICARLLCPDLIMSEPADLHFDLTTRPGHVLLRATSSINNRGEGPLELRAHRIGPRRWAVYQALYTRGGQRRLFRTHVQLVFKYVPGARFEYGDVGAASYWKVEHAAAFELWSIDAHFRTLRLVRRGPKTDYCLRDLFRTHPTAESPAAPVYPGCSQDPALTDDVLGTSPGWADAYPYEYPEQWIDVTGLSGRFAYVQIVDPDRHLIEANHANDVSETFIALPSGRVLGHRGGVKVP